MAACRQSEEAVRGVSSCGADGGTAWQAAQPANCAGPGQPMTTPLEGDGGGPFSPAAIQPLLANPQTPRRARSMVARALAGISPDTVFIAELLVSELVTNAVLHAESGIELEIRFSGGNVHVSVGDEDTSMPRLTSVSDVQALSGRGLQLVDALATSWGWERTPAGKRVWFELPTDDQRS